jgi:hypothetical protein
MKAEYIARVLVEVNHSLTHAAYARSEDSPLCDALNKAREGYELAQKYHGSAVDVATLIRDWLLWPDIDNARGIMGWYQQYAGDLLPHLPPVDLNAAPHS